MLESTKMMPFVQRQRRSKSETVEGAQSNKIKSHTYWNPQTGEQQYQRSYHTVVKVLNPIVAFQRRETDKGTWNIQGIWPWEGPVGFDYKTSRRPGENKVSSIGGHKQNFASTKTHRKGSVIPQETEPKLPASVGGPSVEAWVRRGSPQRWDTGINPWHKPSWSSPLTQSKGWVALRLNSYQEGNAIPPISRYLD